MISAVKQLSIMALTLALVGAGCGGKSSGPTTPVSDAPECIDAATNIRDQMTAAGLQQNADTSELALVARELVVERCTGDAWTAEVILCATTSLGGQLADCTAMLPPAHSEALRGALAPALEATPYLLDLLWRPAPPEAAAPDLAPGGGAPPTDPCGGGE